MSPQLLRIVYFMAMSLAATLCTKWIWKAACHSSLKYEDEVFRYQLKGAEHKHGSAADWLIDTSPTPYKTMLLVHIQSIIKLLPTVGCMFSVGMAFLKTSAFDKLLNILGTVVLILVVFSVVFGLVYKAVGEKIDLEKISDRGIVNYESQMLANLADSYDDGGKQKRFVFRVSQIPEYIFICLWLCGFVFFAYMFVADKAIVDGKIVDSTNLDETHAVTQEYQKIPTDEELTQADENLKKIIEILGNNGYRVFYDDTPGVALYEGVTEKISADKSNNGLDIYCLKDEESAKELMSLWLKNDTAVRTDQRDDYISYTYELKTYSMGENGKEEEEIRIKKVICFKNYVGYINCSQNIIGEIEQILNNIGM